MDRSTNGNFIVYITSKIENLPNKLKPQKKYFNLSIHHLASIKHSFLPPRVLGQHLGIRNFFTIFITFSHLGIKMRETKSQKVKNVKTIFDQQTQCTEPLHWSKYRMSLKITTGPWPVAHYSTRKANGLGH